ncbi:hypothetical protein CN617_31570 [Bacillus wiedmannii]|nr:hypothetical protein CN617_31570 [Bacillus wiedmannii]
MELRLVYDWKKGNLTAFLTNIPGVGITTVATIFAEVGGNQQLQSSQQLVKLVGLSLREHSSGGRS